MSIFVQSILYGELICGLAFGKKKAAEVPWLTGVYTTLFFNTTYALLWRRPLELPLRRDMLWVSLLMFVVATMVRHNTTLFCVLPMFEFIFSRFPACRHQLLAHNTRVYRPR